MKQLECRVRSFFGQEGGNSFAIVIKSQGVAVTACLTGCTPHSTPEDMGKFVHFMINKTVINDEPLISEGLFRKMNRPLSIIGADERMVGYGLANITIFANRHRGQGNSGGIDHYLSNYNYFEESGVGFYYTITHMSMCRLTRKLTV